MEHRETKQKYKREVNVKNQEEETDEKTEVKKREEEEEEKEDWSHEAIPKPLHILQNSKLHVFVLCNLKLVA